MAQGTPNTLLQDAKIRSKTSTVSHVIHSRTGDVPGQISQTQAEVFTPPLRVLQLKHSLEIQRQYMKESGGGGEGRRQKRIQR